MLKKYKRSWQKMDILVFLPLWEKKNAQIVENGLNGIKT